MKNLKTWELMSMRTKLLIWMSIIVFFLPVRRHWVETFYQLPRPIWLSKSLYYMANKIMSSLLKDIEKKNLQDKLSTEQSIEINDFGLYIDGLVDEMAFDGYKVK